MDQYKHIDVLELKVAPYTRNINYQYCINFFYRNAKYVTVLKRSQKNVVEDRNRKGYAEEKWEREVREQIAKKKGTDASKQQKLTKDEQATVDAQMAKEAGIRKHVQEVYGKLIRGLQITRAMINGSKEALEERLVELVRILLAVAEKGAGVLVEENIVDTYLVNACYH